MAKATAGRSATKDRLVDAAIKALRAHGHSGATARQIAAAGGLNQTLIFYHFGSVEDLWLAALDRTSAERLARYEERLAAADGARALVQVARELYREDVASGHVKVLSELVAAGSSSPELGRRVAERVAPWIDLIERTMGRELAGTPWAALLPTRQLANGLAAYYLGAEMLTNLSGSAARAEEMFGVIERLATVFVVMRGEGPGAAR